MYQCGEPDYSPAVLRLRAHRQRPRVDLRHVVGATVCSVYAIEFDQLHDRSRGAARVALARQVAMYLTHVVGRIGYAEVGRMFGRDRTTVQHACALIEDRRDDPDFDRTMDLLEGIVDRMCGVMRVLGRESTH